MNKRRSSRVNRTKKSISTFEVAFLLLAALAIIAAGVNYAVLRNEQVALDRETDQIYQDIKMTFLGLVYKSVNLFCEGNFIDHH